MFPVQLLIPKFARRHSNPRRMSEALCDALPLFQN
jgi:hypothetical protein